MAIIRSLTLPLAFPLALALSVQAPVAAMAAAPVTGSWARVTIYVASVSGSECPSSLKAGLSTVGQVYFAGGGKTGSLLYFYAPNSAATTADIYSAALPSMPASSGGQSSGTISVTDLMSGTNLAGSGQVTLTYGLPSAYFLTLDATLTFFGVTICTLGLNMTAEQTGT